jgi:hypothetical protein
VNYFFFVAEEARQIMAQLGIRTYDELIGRADLLDKSKASATGRRRAWTSQHLLSAEGRRQAPAAAYGQPGPRPGQARWTTS